MRNVGIAVLAGSVGAAVLSLLVWLVGLVTGYTAGGLVHLLLVFAIIVGPVGLIAGIAIIVVGGRNPPR
jgi:hypothetical protein